MRPPSLALAEHLKRLGVAAADELRKKVRLAITDHFGEFLAQLPSALAGQGPEIGTLARAVSDQHRVWLDTYVQRVDAYMIGGAARRSDAAGALAADAAVFTKAIERADNHHRKLVGELNVRVDRIRLTLFLPVYTQAMAPVGLVKSLRETADAMGWPPEQRKPLYELFDEQVIGQLGTLYRSLIGALKIIEPMAARAAAEGPAPAPPSPTTLSAPVAASSSPAPPAKIVHHQPLPQVDPHTVSMLQAFAEAAGDGLYNDASLAADLLSLAENKPLAGLADELHHLPLQRMSLAGRFLNDAISDPFVPDDMRSRHESVRFPVVKSALADSTMFTALIHPMNSLVNDLMLKSATSRLTGNTEARMAVERLEQVLVQFDLAPEFVREAMLTQQPIDEAQIQKFLEMRREEAAQRRQIVINEGRRLVLRELEMSTFGREVPEPAQKFLRGVWGSLLMKRLLRDGAAHERWKEVQKLTERLVDLVEERSLDPGASPEWLELMQTLGEKLAGEGLPSERVSEAIATLSAVRP